MCRELWVTLKAKASRYRRVEYFQLLLDNLLTGVFSFYISKQAKTQEKTLSHPCPHPALIHTSRPQQPLEEEVKEYHYLIKPTLHYYQAHLQPKLR